MIRLSVARIQPGKMQSDMVGMQTSLERSRDAAEEGKQGVETCDNLLILILISRLTRGKKTRSHSTHSWGQPWTGRVKLLPGESSGKSLGARD